jgi:competence protein ComEA
VPGVPEISRAQLFVYAALAVGIALLGARYLRHSGHSKAGRPGAHVTAAHSDDGEGAGTNGSGNAGAVSVARRAGGRAVVDVSGAVRHPGVYRVRSDARVQAAVRRAGGARPRADLGGINLAARVTDGEQIVVPARVSGAGAGDAPPSGAAADPGTADSSTPINLNTATLAQLETLDGVGPVTAQKILAYRKQHGGISSVDELDRVPGIGPATIASLRPRVIG